MELNDVIMEDDLVPAYIAKCNYAWPEFFDKGAFTYSEVRFCDYREELDCSTLEEAEKLVEAMNEEKACPRCGKRRKFVATTNYDLFNERRLINSLNAAASNAR